MSLTDSVIQLDKVSKIKKLYISESSFCYTERLKDMEDLADWPGPGILEDDDEANDMIIAVRNKLYVFEKNMVGIIEELNEKRIEHEEEIDDLKEQLKNNEDDRIKMKEFMEDARKEIHELKTQINCLMSNQKN